MVAKAFVASWLALLAVPLVALFVEEPDFAWICLAIYGIGTFYLLRATTSDPERRLLTEFLLSHFGRTLCVLVALMTVGALFAPKAATGAILLLFSAVLVNWARASSVRQLQLAIAKPLLAFGTVALCLFGMEMALRLLQSDQPQNGGAWTWGHEVRTNRLGFRERDFLLKKPEGTYRVMVVGDSLTWGAGLPEEQRYTHLLQDQLANAGSSQHVEVLNFGLPGAPTTVERDIIVEHLPKIRADLLVLGFCINDPQPHTESYARELDKFQPLFKVYRTLGKHMGATKLANYLQLRTDAFLRRIQLVPSYHTSLDRCYARDSEEWERFEEALRQIQTLCQANAMDPPVFLALPQGNGDYRNPDEHLRYITKWLKQATGAAQRAGFQTVDALPVFETEGARSRHVNAWDGHPDAQCNAVYAATLEPVIRGKLR